MAERLTDIELSSISLHETKPRVLHTDSILTGILQEDDIETAVGSVHVCVQGNRSKPAIFTYHDIGLNSTTCFQGFFNYPEMQPILNHFCVYHVNAPGQHEGAIPLPQGGMKQSESDRLIFDLAQSPDRVSNIMHKRASYQYPSMEQLGDMLLPVMQFYSVKTFIGFGVGAGANVLSNFALNHPERVEALVLLNGCAGRSSWTEWGYQKFNSWYLKSGQLTAGAEEYLLWHWFGKSTVLRNHDLVTVFSDYIKAVNPTNLGLFIDAYIGRSDLGIERCLDSLKKDDYFNFKCPVMLVAGEYSPHLNSVIDMNSRLDPTNSTWMKFECGGMVHEEAPSKLTEAFRLFLQGMGYVPSISQTKLVEARSRASMKCNPTPPLSNKPSAEGYTPVGAGHGDTDMLVHRTAVC